MTYFKVKKEIGRHKIGTIFCVGLQFQTAVSERFNWKQIYSISKEEVSKYRKLLTKIKI